MPSCSAIPESTATVDGLFEGSGFRVWGVGFRVQGAGFSGDTTPCRMTGVTLHSHDGLPTRKLIYI